MHFLQTSCEVNCLVVRSFETYLLPWEERQEAKKGLQMSLFGNMKRSFVESRMRRVKGQLYATLLEMDEETVRRAGFSRKELREGATHRFLI